VDISNTIGLLPGFGFLTGHSFYVTLLICWAITPVGHLLVGLVGESRLVPLRSSEQYLSFFPGDLFLGTAVAGYLVLAGEVRHEDRWFNSLGVHLVVLIGALVVASLLTLMELKGGAYPPRAIKSPTKIYHNFVLYGLYGYVAFVSLMAVFVGMNWNAGSVVAASVSTIFGLVWVRFVFIDSTLTREESAKKAMHAHISDWKPIWVRRSK